MCRTTLGGPSVVEKGHDMMSIPMPPAFLMSPGLHGRCWRWWQPASGSHIRGIAQGVSTQRVTLESQCIRCRCLTKPWGNGRAGRNIANSRDICLGSKAEGRVKDRRAQQSLSVRGSVCGKCRERREGGRRRATWGRLGGGWVRGGSVFCFIRYVAIYLYRYRYV